MKIDVTINAGQTLEYYEPGDFFRLLDTVGPVSITFYKQGKEVSEAENVGEGFAEKFRVGDFDRIQIYSATTQAIQFVIRLGADVYYDKPPTGSVTLSGMQGAFLHVAATVTTTSGSIIGSKQDRRYLLIQNKSATGTIWLNFAGGLATTSNGVRIGPGESIEISGYVPISDIWAIGDIASNPDVVVVQG